MKAGSWWWVVGLLVVGTGGCERKEEAAPETAGQEEGSEHILARAGHRLPVGSTVTTRHVLVLSDATMALEREGKRVMGTMEMQKESEVRMEIVSEHETRLRVVSDRQVVTHSVDGAGPSGQPVDGPLVGREVLFTRGPDGWVGKLEDGEASEEEAAGMESLAGHLDEDDALAMYGSGPRRVGEEWEVDPRQASFMGAGADFDGVFRLRFDRVEEFAGTPCAVLQGTVNVSGRLESGDGGGGEIKISVPRAVIYRALGSLENLKSEFAGEMSKAENPEPGESALVRGRLTIVRESAVVLP